MGLINFFKKSAENDFNVLGINERNSSLIYPNNNRKIIN